MDTPWMDGVEEMDGEKRVVVDPGQIQYGCNPSGFI